MKKTAFIYNIVLSNQFNISKRFKNKCKRLLVEIQKYLTELALQKYFDAKTEKYLFNHYKILMNRIDYLFKLFDDIDGSKDIKNIWIEKLKNYHYDTEGLYRSGHAKDYIGGFSIYFINSVYVKSLTKTCKYIKYYNDGFCLL